MSPAAARYAVDPFTGVAAALSDADKEKMIRGEACVWWEYASAENVDSSICPRLAAIAERLWSPESITDVDSMYASMKAVSRCPDSNGLTQITQYEVMLRR